MKQNKLKTVAIVIFTNIIVIAAAIGIALGLSAAFKTAKAPVEEKPVYTVKVNEATGAEEYYNENGEFEYQISKEYSDTEKKQISREIYADAENKTTKIVYYAEGTKTIDRVDEYENGNVSVQHRYENGADTGECWKFKYDEKGRQISSTNCDAQGNEIIKKEQSYNKFGKPDVYTELDANGSLIAKTEYNYDKKGNEIKTVFYDANGVVGYVEYEYDSQGRKSRMNQYKDGKLLDYRIFKYAKDGTCTEELHTPEKDK